MHMRLLSVLLVLTGLAACSRPAPPASEPPPIVAPPPRVVPVPSPYVGDWRDWPLTPGTWIYRHDARGSLALFGQPGQTAEVTLRCDTAARAIYLARRGAVPAAMTVRTTTLTRALSTQATGGTPPYVAATLTPTDGLLDAMGFSRGRFILELPGATPLVIPAYAEVLRTVEDCRG